MVDLNALDQFRDSSPEVIARYGWAGDDSCGAFWITKNQVPIRVIASSGLGWDHVSVSCQNRTPTWDEMDLIKRMFFHPEEVAMQLHVPNKEHINCHHYTLHLWRPHDQKIPRPPADMV